jgi:hypothetical protein
VIYRNLVNPNDGQKIAYEQGYAAATAKEATGAKAAPPKEYCGAVIATAEEYDKMSETSRYSAWHAGFCAYYYEHGPYFKG